MTDDELMVALTTLLEGEVAYRGQSRRRVPYFSGSGRDAALFAVLAAATPITIILNLYVL